MATPVPRSIPLSDNPLVDGLVQGSSWQLGGDRLLTYAFYDMPGWDRWEPAQRDAVRDVFHTLETYANLHFAEVAPVGDGSNASADLSLFAAGRFLDARFGAGTTSYGVFPDPAAADTQSYALGKTPAAYPTAEGDVYLGTAYGDFDHMGAGGAGRTIAIEGILNALGLKHPDDTGLRDRPIFAEIGMAHADNDSFTVMSSHQTSSSIAARNPATAMMLDVAALQQIYGANTGYAAGNDVWVLDASSTKHTLWDGGGANDWLSADRSTGAVWMDVSPGGWNYVRSLGLQTEIAYGTVIEHASGSAYDDVVLGNGVYNMLIGNAGNDWIDGRAGSDVLLGGAGRDVLFGGDGADSLYGGIGADLFSYVAVTESAPTAAQPFAVVDTIFDYNRPEGDRIDLSRIDADPFLAGDQAFAFTSIVTAIGQVHFYYQNGNTVVEAETDGLLTVPDLRIVLAGIHDMTSADFIL